MTDHAGDMHKVPRSILFVPADRPELAPKAAASKSDAICIDLEDSVAPHTKESARIGFANFFPYLRDYQGLVFVRVNADLDLCVQDIKCLSDECDGVVLSKASGFDHIALVGDLLEKKISATKKHFRLIALIEDAKSLNSIMAERSKPHRLFWALALGGEDLSTDLLCNTESELLTECFLKLAFAAKIIGVNLIGYPGSIANFRDLEKFRANAEFASRNGASGGFCIHPAQVGPLNAAFSISSEDYKYAEEIINAFNESLKNGRGVTVVNGKMIDRPVALRAEAILRRHVAYGSASGL